MNEKLNSNKQIEEMCEIVRNHCKHCPYEDEDISVIDCGTKCKMTELYNKGYRKERQGEWIKVLTGFRCSLCDTHEAKMTKFCPECGAHMKGEDNG